MDHFEKFEDQLISSYKSTLAVEGREICEKIDSLLKDDIDLIREKHLLIVFFAQVLKKLLLIKICLIDVKSIEMILETIIISKIL